MMNRSTKRRTRLVAAAMLAIVATVGATTAGALSGRGSREISESTAGIAGNADPGDFIAAALATGDFDGDGNADALVGGPNEDLGKKADAGQIHVVYGSNSGLRSRNKLIHQGTAEVVGKSAAGDRFGAAVVSGDFDNDGIDDAAIGVPGKDLEGIGDAGKVVVLYGRKKKGLSGVRSASLSQLQEGLGGAAGTRHEFGHSLATGDFNNDGYTDLAVGVPGHSTSATRGGAVAVVYGGPGGLSAAGADTVTQNTQGMGDATDAGDQLGWAVDAGDFNNDGHDDLAVGVPGETLVSAEPGAGVVHVIYGSASGIITDVTPDVGEGAPPPNPVATVTSVTFSEDTPGVKGPTEARDAFGASLAVGNFDGNAYDDLAIGVPGESKGVNVSSGLVHVLDGSATGLTGRGAAKLGQAGKAVPTDATAGDEFGLAIVAGDFNGNGRDDLAVGVPGERVGSKNSAGIVHVFVGRKSGISKKGVQTWQPGEDGVAGRAEANAGVGRAVASGDVDGDGRDDLLIGSPGRTIGRDGAAGSFLVLYG